MTTNIDGRLASAILIFVTGVSAVILVEKAQSRLRTSAADRGQWLMNASDAQSALLVDTARGAMTTIGFLVASRGRAPSWLLPDSELCR